MAGLGAAAQPFPGGKSSSGEDEGLGSCSLLVPLPAGDQEHLGGPDRPAEARLAGVTALAMGRSGQVPVKCLGRICRDWRTWACHVCVFTALVSVLLGLSAQRNPAAHSATVPGTQRSWGCHSGSAAEPGSPKNPISSLLLNFCEHS